MFCKRCGKRVDTSVSVCPHCGRDVDAVSGGTGFWDLMNESPEPPSLQDRPVQTTQVPIVEDRADPDDAETRAQTVVELPQTVVELPQTVVEPPQTVVDVDAVQPVSASDTKTKQERAADMRGAPRNRVAPIIIGVLAICVLVLAVMLMIPRCTRTGEEGPAQNGATADGTSNGNSSEKNGRFEREYEEYGALSISNGPGDAATSQEYAMGFPASPSPSDSSSNPTSPSPSYPTGSSSSDASSFPDGSPSSRYDSTSVGSRQTERNQMNGQQQVEGVQNAQ